MWILFILFLIPFIVYILNVKHYKLQNFLYFFKFLFFNIIVLCYSILYLLYYIIYFVFKNYRFFSYYYQIARVSKFYYNKKSIYFLFWKYLTIYIIANIYNFIIYLLYSIIIFFKKYFYINNVFLIVLINSKFLLFSDAIKNLIYLLYNSILLLSYHFFNFININWIYVFTKRINILHRWNNIQDPFLRRNTYIKFIDFFNYWILQNANKNILYVNLFALKNILKKYILSYIFVIIHNWDTKNLHKFLLNIWIMQKIQLSKGSYFFNTIVLLIFYVNVVFINFIYILLMFVLNTLHIILNTLWKYRIYFVYILILFLCIKYYWCIHYYFLVLYKHYTLYLPVFEVKESFRFFNFEWIDMSNYYDLVLFRNTLIDASVFNNSIYNDLLNNLSQTLYLYGFKITPKYNIALYSALKDIYNKDTDLLNNMFKIFNENKSYKKYKWYIRMRKIFNNKLKSVYHYYKPKKGLSRREKRLGEYLYNRININTKAQDTRHLIEKKLPMTQEVKNKLGIYNFYTKGYYRKKISKKFAMLNLGHFLKVKKIPLRYTSIHSTDYTDQRLISIFKWLKENTEKSKFIKLFNKKFKFGVNSLKKLICSHDYKFFLGQFYSFTDYGVDSEHMVYKHKIPTFNWTIARWKRRVPNRSTVDFIYTSTIDTEHPFMTYRDVPRKKVFLKRNFKIRFIYTHYPYSINQYYDIKRSVNYFGVINNLKIIKKYYYIYNTKLYFNKKYYTMTLESNRVFIKQFLYRLSLIKKPFNKLHFFKSKKNAKNNTNFWFFFDYMKTNKYFHHKYNNIYGNQHYVNFYFIKRTRKGYIKLRNDLIRMYSLYFYYRNFERAMYKNWWPDTLSSFEQNLRNQDRFDSLRTAWFTYSYLTNDRTNIKLLKNIRILNHLFRENFMSYYIYCDHNINYPNIGYHEQIDTYKLKVLNKISNLKRFFYFQNKRNSGWSIFKYLNVFSVKYHIKHFLWHNPYSFLIYKNKFLYKVTDYNLNYIFLYMSNNEIVECSKYSLIFNFYLNTFEINSDILNLHLNKDFIHNELKNYYSFGVSNYYNSSDFEIYRIIMNFIFYYYKNFIYRLVRYRYILDHKNYTLLKFFKRYFNIVDWFYHSYFRFRWLIHKYIFFGNFIKKSYYKFFKFRYIYSFRVRRLAFLPLWFYFDDFTKIFMHIVLDKFYTKSNFLLYWVYVNYNFNLIYICIYFYNFKFWLLNNTINIMLNHLFIKFKNFEIDFKILNNELLYLNNIFKYNFSDDKIQNLLINFESLYIKIYNNKFKIEYNLNNIFFMIYSKIVNILLMFKNIISKICLNSDSFIYVKWYISIILKSYNNIWLNIIYTHIKVLIKIYYLNFNIKILLKLNNFIFIKYYLSKLLLYYIKILFNINNTLVYFKPNYYSFRQQKNLRYTKKFKVYFKTSFVSTRTVRSIYSFKHYTDNMAFLQNISFFNIYNYLYLMNNYDINLLNISTNLFIVFKNQSIIYIIFIYLFIYIIFFIILFVIYRKFYNIYFFCQIINNDLQDNWDKMFNNSTKLLLKKVTKHKLKYFNYLWKNKRTQNFYNFFSFNLLMSKKDLTQQFLFKIFIKSKLYNKIQKKFNNNYIINIKNTKLLLDFSTVLYKIYDFMKFASARPYKITKEKKTFDIYFYSLLNSNIFNLCFLYWFILIPYFFFEYIWMRYHLKGHIRIKRRYFLLLRVCLNNFKFYVQLSKLIGLNNYYTSHKKKLPRNYLNGTRYRRKRKLKFGFFFKWDRFSNTLVRLSSLGNYFYWFAHINKWEYFLSYKKYFFNFSYNSNYYYFIYIYIVFLVVKLWKYKKYNKYNKCRI